jgi:beta-N-acetylhexosaminidase
MSKESEQAVADMPLEEKIGLLLWCPFYGSHSWYEGPEAQIQRRMLSKRLLGGILVKEGELYETATLIHQIQQDIPQPVVVAADLENGLGSLLKEGTRFPSNLAFGATRSGEYGYLAGKIIAEEAAAVGINLIFGPTCSRTGSGLPEGLPPTRSFGERLHLVTRLSVAFIRGVHDGGSLAVPRYFPGTAAVHSGKISGSKWLHYLRKLLVDTELSIYEILSQAGLAALMVDWREMPDLLTGKSMLVLNNRHLLEVFLREVIDFKGVVISPDLSEPDRARLLDQTTLVGAINAGVDILAGVPEPERVARMLVDAVVQEKIPLSRIDKAAERILAFKRRIKKTGSTAIRPEEIDRRVANSANLEVSDRIAEDSITLLRNRGDLLPLDPAEHRTLLNLSFLAKSEPDLERPLDEALRKTFDRVITRRIDSQVSSALLDEAWGEAGNADAILCAMFTNMPPEYSAHGFTATQIEFIQRLIEGETRMIMASFGDPLTISLFPEVDCYLCLYSDSPASQTALVNELFGKLVMPVKGKLPVTLDANFHYGFGLDLNP